MSPVQPPDRLMNALASLPAVQPDPVRSEAIRARCRAVFDADPSQDPARHLDPAAAGVACAYAWQVAKLALLLVR